MMKTYLIILYVIAPMIGVAQKNNQVVQPTPIYFEEFNLWITEKKTPVFLVRNMDDSTTIKIYLKSGKGSATFQIFDKKGQLSAKGEYSDSRGLFRQYTYKYNADGVGWPIVFTYFQPCRYGEWLWYSNIGKLLRKENYIVGPR